MIKPIKYYKIKIIVDTSVLISLAKIDRLEILARLTENLAIPEDVYEEAVVEGEKKDIPDATIIKMFVAGHNIPVAKVQRDFMKMLFSNIKKKLPKGDSAVLSLAAQESAKEIMTDDEGLGKIALSLGFDVVASPDLMLRALIAGEIKFRDFEKSIRSLVLENRLGSTVAELYIKEGQEYVEI